MSIKVTQPNAYADLGDVWLRDQSARLMQKHLQFGRHYRMDADALLARLACTARAARTPVMPVANESSSTDHIRRATIEAIEYCSWLESPPDAAAAAIAH
jgi:hypothetical protein